MLMAAATHMGGGGSAHSSSSSISPPPPPPPPWHPVVLVPKPNHSQHQQALSYDHLDLVTASPATPPTPQRLRPTAAPRAGKQQQRRPRPSRKLLPTTYISADAASFRRMVHQVTGADGHASTDTELLCRPAPAPSRAAFTPATATLLLPTLDTSAFLLGAAARGGRGSRRTPPPLAWPGGASAGRHGSAAAGNPGAALTLQAAEACGDGGVRAGGGGGGEYGCSNGSGGGFPGLESWDDDAMFQDQE